MHQNLEELLRHVATFLAGFYLVACAMNLAAAALAARAKKVASGVAWLAVAALFGLFAYRSLAGTPPLLPEPVKAAVDAVLGPVTFTLGALLGLAILYVGRHVFVIPAVAWAGLNVSLLWLGLSMTDPQFAAVVTTPDNVPIVALVYLLAFFTWFSARAAVENDRRLAAGSPPVEQEQKKKVLVWPDLVYTELICMILLAVLLIVWSLGLTAPLEEPANPVVTPNPSKAPWYFQGLQEMLVYSDPWYVGVVVPLLIILGLMAIPYLDFNKQGSGYYTIRQRPFAYITFQFGFLGLWILLILIGTFMRGPNWNFFGPYEARDIHTEFALGASRVENAKLSEVFWTTCLGRAVPEVSADSGMWARLASIVYREIAGIVFMAGYFLAVPVLLGRTVFRNLRQQMSPGRYALMVSLLLLMLTLPLKMILRWTLNLSYLVSMPEYFLNF